MKFLNMNLFRGGAGIESVVGYLSTELAANLRDLNTGLTKLKLTENFEGFEAVVIFPGSGEIAIRHNAGFIPSQRIIVRANASDIVDGDTEWNRNFVYMKKTGAGLAQATIIFLR